MSISKEQVVVEEILAAAIDGARDALKESKKNPFESGRLMAYYDIIAVAQEQARLMDMEFADKSLAAFDPDKELLQKQAA